MVSDQQLQELRRRDAHHATGKVAKKVPPFSPKGTPSFRTPKGRTPKGTPSFQSEDPKGDTQFSDTQFSAQRGHPVFGPKGPKGTPSFQSKGVFLRGLGDPRARRRCGHGREFAQQITICHVL